MNVPLFKFSTFKSNFNLIYENTRLTFLDTFAESFSTFDESNSLLIGLPKIPTPKYDENFRKTLV